MEKRWRKSAGEKALDEEKALEKRWKALEWKALEPGSLLKLQLTLNEK